MAKRLLIIGGGGHGRAVAEAVLLRKEYLLTAFLDDALPLGQKIWDYPIWGPTERLASCRDLIDAAVVAVGNNVLRESLHRKLHASGIALASVIHPAAVVSPRAFVGEGSAIMAGAIVGTGARLGEGVIVNCGAVIDHDCLLEPFGHLGVSASMAGGSVLGRSAWMPVGSVLACGVKISADRVLRAGEVVAA